MFKLPAPAISDFEFFKHGVLIALDLLSICVCLCSIILNKTIQESLRLIFIHKSSHNLAPQLNFFIGILYET